MDETPDTSKSTLKPSIRQMLVIAGGCGLKTLDEAYNNYMNHYDCFFLISDFNAQHTQFVRDMIALGFVKDRAVVEMTIDEALAKL